MRLNLLSENYIEISKLVNSTAKLTESHIKNHYHDVLTGFDELKSSIDGVELQDSPEIINFRNDYKVFDISDTDTLNNRLYPGIKIIGTKSDYGLKEAAELSKLYDLICETVEREDDIDAMYNLFGDFEVKKLEEGFILSLNATGKVHFSNNLGKLRSVLKESQLWHDDFYKNGNRDGYRKYLEKRILIKEFADKLK